MEFRFSPELEGFRSHIRELLTGILTDDFRSSEIDEGGWSPRFSRLLGQEGLVALAWPKEYGGQAGSYFEQLVYGEELARVDAPTRFHFMGSSLVGPSILLFGNEQQKVDYLPRITRGEISFCQGFSEPNSGSDLASLRVSARRDGDEYVISGQKIWTSDGHRADYCWLGARTDPDAPKHKGISTFVVDMRTEGIEVRPLLTMNNHHHFNEVFFNDVRIPAENLVGVENRGWYQMTTTLDFERSGASRFVGLKRILDDLANYLRADAVRCETGLKVQLADAVLACEVGQLLAYRVAWMQSRGQIPNYEASMSKAYGSSLEQHVANLAVKIGGLTGCVDARNGLGMGDAYMWSAAASIRGGTNEVQKNIIATRGLGLPRI